MQNKLEYQMEFHDHYKRASLIASFEAFWSLLHDAVIQKRSHTQDFAGQYSEAAFYYV